MSNVDLARVRVFQFFLVLAAVEGLLSVGASLSTPSMDRRALLLGYSAERILLTLAFFAPAVALSIAAILALRDPSWIRRILDRLATGYLSTEYRLLGSLVITLFLLIVSVYLFYLFVGYGVPNAPYPLQIAFEKFAFPMAWGIALWAEIAVVLVLLFSQRIRYALRIPRNISFIVLLIVLVGTSIHWITLALGSDFWTRIPGWYWPFYPSKRFQPSIIYILIASLLGFFIVRSVLRNPQRRLRNIILCVGLAYTLQIGFGFASGMGYESIRLRYAKSRISDKLHYGCEAQTSIPGTIKQYEGLFGDTFWLGTKPPGLVVFYQTVRDLFGAIDPAAVEGSNNCFRSLTTVFAIVLPLVSSLVVLPLFGTESLLGGGRERYVSSFLYMSTPSFLLLPLFADQFLYPLLFMISVLGLAITLARRSFIIGLVTGGVIYLSIFVSFSLLPLLGLAIIWPLFEGLFGRRGLTISRAMYSVLGIVLGIVVLWLAGLLLIGYDPMARYIVAFDLHREIKRFSGVPAKIFQYAHLNNVELAIWTGWPFFVLLISGWLASVLMAIRRKAAPKSVFAVSVLATYLLLNIVGQTRGEVGRLWIFILPVAAIVASNWATKLLRDPKRSVQLVFMLQLGTSALAFIFLDFFR